MGIETGDHKFSFGSGSGPSSSSATATATTPTAATATSSRSPRSRPGATATGARPAAGSARNARPATGRRPNPSPGSRATGGPPTGLRTKPPLGPPLSAPPSAPLPLPPPGPPSVSGSLRSPSPSPAPSPAPSQSSQRLARTPSRSPLQTPSQSPFPSPAPSLSLSPLSSPSLFRSPSVAAATASALKASSNLQSQFLIPANSGAGSLAQHEHQHQHQQSLQTPRRPSLQGQAAPQIPNQSQGRSSQQLSQPQSQALSQPLSHIKTPGYHNHQHYHHHQYLGSTPTGPAPRKTSIPGAASPSPAETGSVAVTAFSPSQLQSSPPPVRKSSLLPPPHLAGGRKLLFSFASAGSGRTGATRNRSASASANVKSATGSGSSSTIAATTADASGTASASTSTSATRAVGVIPDAAAKAMAAGSPATVSVTASAPLPAAPLLPPPPPPPSLGLQVSSSSLSSSSGPPLALTLSLYPDSPNPPPPLPKHSPPALPSPPALASPAVLPWTSAHTRSNNNSNNAPAVRSPQHSQHHGSLHRRLSAAFAQVQAPVSSVLTSVQQRWSVSSAATVVGGPTEGSTEGSADQATEPPAPTTPAKPPARAKTPASTGSSSSIIARRSRFRSASSTSTGTTYSAISTASTSSTTASSSAGAPTSGLAAVPTAASPASKPLAALPSIGIPPPQLPPLPAFVSSSAASFSSLASSSSSTWTANSPSSTRTKTTTISENYPATAAVTAKKEEPSPFAAHSSASLPLSSLSYPAPIKAFDAAASAFSAFSASSASASAAGPQILTLAAFGPLNSALPDTPSHADTTTPSAAGNPSLPSSLSSSLSLSSLASSSSLSSSGTQPPSSFAAAAAAAAARPPAPNHPRGAMYNGHGYDYYNHPTHNNLRINTHAVPSLPLDPHETNSSGMTPTPDTAILMPASYDRFHGGVGLSASAGTPPAHASSHTNSAGPASSTSDIYPPSSSSATRAASIRSRSTADGSQHSSSRSRKLSQKEMLSRALQKANTAVELDNVQNFEGARRAYIEASELLNQVILRVGVDDVRRRLEEIRDRYTSRIEELDGMGQLEYEDEKELPARPDRDSIDSMPPMTSSLQFDDDGDGPDEMMSPRTTITHTTSSSIPTPSSASHFGSSLSRSPGQPPMMLPIPERPHRPGQLHSAFSTSPGGANDWRPSEKSYLQRPEDEQYMPRPLSPYSRIPGSQGQSPSFDYSYNQGQLHDASRSDYASSQRLDRQPSGNSLHARAMSQDSWLDHAGSGDSTVSSLHSRTSSLHQPSRQSLQMRMSARNPDFEFDAALDAAVEAAYDDPYEPLTPVAHRQQHSMTQEEDRLALTMRKVEQAKERVRQTQMEASRLEQDRHIRERELLEEEERQYQELHSNNRHYPHHQSRPSQGHAHTLSAEASTIPGGDFFDDANSSDEEEQMLEEMSMGYKVEDLETRAHGHERLHSRDQSHEDSYSETQPDIFTARTWFSTGTSAPPSATFLGSSPSESQSQDSSPTSGPGQGPNMPSQFVQAEPVAPPPDMGLPDLPAARTRPRAPSSVSLSVRNRRLSGQNPKQLVIETASKRQLDSSNQITEVSTPATNDLDKDTGTDEDHMQQNPVKVYDDEESGHDTGDDSTDVVPKHPPTLAPPIPVPSSLNSLNVHATPPMGTNEFDDIPENGRSVSPISSRVLRKNYSSTSLRSARTRNMSVSNIDDSSVLSPGTPASSYTARNGHYPTVPAPLSAAFNDHVKNESTEGIYFADMGLNHINSQTANGGMPISPRPGHVAIDPKTPVPLEPCPNDFLLRPFWLMRCLYQTLCHPCGGFVSNKLFVPRDAWRVKGVKLKNLDDKIAVCDVLIAALERLGRVDTNDADLVLEEMQSLEIVLDQLTPQLARKLGTEVGVQTPGVLFRESANGAEAETNSSVPRSTSVSGKAGSSFSWRRLRSKTSQAGLTNQYTSGGSVSSGTSRGGDSFAYTNSTGGAMSKRDTPPAAADSLPMTMNPMAKPPRRDVRSVQFAGPNAVYMETLARLFDAAQTVDQIARQVEDPGLKHADKTQVGLELCTRHAAEFFAFYIVRFVMADLSHLLDKYVKRGTEWATT
ncbi:hypothetical protein BROUX41_002257 [Berkeleyomyces rouxiae]